MIASRLELAGIHSDYCPICGNQPSHHWPGCPFTNAYGPMYAAHTRTATTPRGEQRDEASQ